MVTTLYPSFFRFVPRPLGKATITITFRPSTFGVIWISWFIFKYWDNLSSSDLFHLFVVLFCSVWNYLSSYWQSSMSWTLCPAFHILENLVQIFLLCPLLFLSEASRTILSFDQSPLGGCIALSGGFGDTVNSTCIIQQYSRRRWGLLPFPSNISSRQIA